MPVTINDAVSYLNETLVTLGYGHDFQIPTPTADPDNTQEVAAALQALAALSPNQKNAIMEQLNLVVQNRNFGVMFDASKNKFRSFIVNMTETGFGIEDLFHELIEGGPALWDDKTNTNDILTDLVSYDTNKIDKAFHTDKFNHQFKTTIDVRNYDKVFTTTGVVRYVDTKLANLQWSAEVYLMQVVIDIVKKMIKKGDIVFNTGNSINDKEGLQNTVEKIKYTVDGFLTPCDLYNRGAVEWVDGQKTFRKVVNMTDTKDDIFIITRPDYMERLKVQGYSNAFNLSQFELDGRIIYVPMGTSLGTITVEGVQEEVQFVVLDRRAILAGIRYWLGSSEYISNVHRINHWLTIEGIRGYNTFFNAVAFTGETLGNFLDGNTKDSPAGIAEFNGSDITEGNVFLKVNGVYAGSLYGNEIDKNGCILSVKEGDVITIESDVSVGVDLGYVFADGSYTSISYGVFDSGYVVPEKMTYLYAHFVK